MTVIIRSDGDSEIGYGHLFRTSAIAEELLERGHPVTYATTTPNPVESVCPSGIDILTLPSRTNSQPLVERMNETVDIVLVDSYAADENYQQRIREEVPVVLITDDTRCPVAADVVVNGNLYAPALEYDVCGEEPTWCLGPTYLLLRQSIVAQASDEPPWRDPPERALITMGSSDPTERTPTVLRAFDGLSIRVDAIIGPGFSDEQAHDVYRTAETISTPVEPIRDPDDLSQRMFRADFAVSTASTTTYELLALGTPIVCQPVVDNQECVATALRERGIATVLERTAGKTVFREAVETYLADAALRKERRTAGRELIDGQGAERVVDVIRDVIDR